ncbi:formate dehydrogenase delta subunit [Micromonospora pisi]|uniref:Formate dehydrogenase delta subunit n=1 Tax=Micromonospora pisi TaxID=589240 RepID=A0A495JNQ6_9ACTN|nr:formate dehydrogenase subunit delta [Micromonospora pisi]RKR90566.1 formate dehydrogenase delta subunit [Micromonospora pisi]
MAHQVTSPSVRLANEIAAHFHHETPEKAAAQIAEHIRLFWDPRMRAELDRRVESEPDELDPLALAAARLLAEK